MKSVYSCGKDLVDIIIAIFSLMFFFLIDLFTDNDDCSLNDCPFCDKTKQDYENVKEEFERYKLRAQSVLKNKNTKV